MNRMLVFLVWLMVWQNLWSQNLKKGFLKLDQGKHAEALEVFSEAVKNKKDPIVAKFGLALVYADSTYPKADYAKAYRNLGYCQRMWAKTEAPLQQAYQRDYLLDMPRMLLLDSLIQWRAYAQYRGEKDPVRKQKFEENFRDAPLLHWIRSEGARMAFAHVRTALRPEPIDSFLLRYADSQYADTALALSQRLWTDRYRQMVFDGTRSTYNLFLSTYPEHRVPDSLMKAELALILDSEQLHLAHGYQPTLRDRYIEYVRLAGPKYTLAFKTLQLLLAPDIEAQRWTQAAELAAELAPSFAPQHLGLQNLLAALRAPAQNLNVKPLSDVNTPASEYIPVVSANGAYLYFCGFRRADALGQEDIYFSQRMRGQWQQPQVLNELSTAEGFEAPLAVSADGNTLIYFHNRLLYFAKRSANGWGAPTRLAEPINSKYWQGEAQLTSDGRALLFVSDRPGGQGHFYPANREYHGGNYGNIDVYISFRQGENTWSEPINLGPVVNTPFCERGIFLHPDMRTLYFSSDGHGGLGGMDIYKTTRLSDDSWTEWSTPVNLGKGINTVADDWGYKISTDGTQAYFSAQANNQYDLFVMDLPQAWRPNPISTISGRLLDTQGAPLSGTIKWEDLSTGQTIGQAESNPIDGSYFLVVQLGRNYGYFVEKQGYFPAASNIDLRQQTVSVAIEHDIVLQSINQVRGGEAVRLNNLFFDTDSYTLKQESFPELLRIAGLIQQHPSLRFEIGGHTDNQGEQQHNRTLSENRAQAVRLYLTQQGCATQQLTVQGYGSQKPVATNDTRQGRALNRRVELRVIE